MSQPVLKPKLEVEKASSSRSPLSVVDSNPAGAPMHTNSVDPTTSAIVDFCLLLTDAETGLTDETVAQNETVKQLGNQIAQALQAKYAKPSPQAIVESKAQKAPQSQPAVEPLGDFCGILGRCKIAGCDVHELNWDFDIVQHIKLDRRLQGKWLDGRQTLNRSAANLVACFIYKNDIVRVYSDGSEKRGKP